MSFDVLFELVTNIILLMSLTMVYSMFSNSSRLSRLSSKLVMGISVSLIGFIVMKNSVVISPGVMFDGRSVLMLITGMYFGVLPVLIGGISLSFYRVYLGGAGVIPGILWVVLPGILGSVWRFYRLKRKSIDISEISYMEQYLLILVNQILVISILFLFPNKVPVDSINQISIPLLVIYPFGGLLVSMFTLRQRKSYLQANIIKQRERELHDLFNGGTNYSFILEPDTKKIINVNQVAINKYGYSFEEFTSMTAFDINVYSKEQILNIIANANERNYTYFLLKHKLKSGEIIDVEVRSAPIEIDGKIYSYSNATDVTTRLEDEKKYKDVNRRLKATLHNIFEGIIVTDEAGNIDIINQVGKKYLDNGNSNLIGSRLTDLVRIYSNDQQVDLNSIYNQVITSNTSFESDQPFILLTNNNDYTIYIDFSLSPITYDDGYTKGSILVFRDVTVDYEKTNKIEYVSQHDFLTGLYNRYFLDTELKRLDTKRQLPISLILGDTNGLKLVNDSFGHIEGDNLLKEIAQILRKATRSEDIIARWGGDEFIILLPQTTKENAEKVRTRIEDLSNKSRFNLITPSISLGISTKTTEDEEIEGVLIEAEKEMYFNKQEDGKKMRFELLHNLEQKLCALHPELGSHSPNVEKLAIEFGKYLKLSKEELSTLRQFAKYHDIGWTAIDEHLLVKTDPLTSHDLDKIRIHPQVGFRIMKSIPELSHIAELINCHHERWDGTGYPEGLKGENIPLLARILPIIDTYDTMINISIYKDKKSHSETLDEISANSGTQFDPNLVAKFLEMSKKTI